MSGLVFTLTVRDQEKLAKVQDKLLALGQVLLRSSPSLPSRSRPKMSAASRCITSSRMGQWLGIRRGQWSTAGWSLRPPCRGSSSTSRMSGKKSLGELPAVAKRLESGPMMLSYQDSLNSLRQMFAAIQTFGPMFVGQLAAAGIKVELPTLPDLDAIESHILPRIDSTRAQNRF